MSSGIAIVGMACCYPDASNPRELWENVLAQRRAFRRLPPERLRLDDYLSNDPSVPDTIYASEAALIEGYEFDRVRFRVPGPTFRSVDLAHWLALDVADQALRDAGFIDGHGLPLENTGVLVGNTLTGEFSRAGTMRLRWPYVRRVVEARMVADGWDKSRRSEFLDQLEKDYKAPFPNVDGESLAGALSNTIAGRICNYFHFGGGGYTVDGACSSSLLGVAKACSALEAGELDAAVAGGVDLSLDPFELVGFAKAGALARGEMRIYDKDSTGFLPGEGSGFVVLMRLADAISQRLQVYAIIRGWGISSDGGGGITRPDVRGQMLALERAYRRANYEFDSVALIEGHGTGTLVGDDVELKALCAMRRRAGEKTHPAAIGSIKANFGHTKAAAGIAGLIKATLAVHHQVLPPTTGVRQPSSEVQGKQAVLRVLAEAEPWPADMPVRAGINSFGFGGINVHVAIEGYENECRTRWSANEKATTTCSQDVELFFLEGGSPVELAEKIERLAHLAPNLSRSDLTDLSTMLARQAGVRRARASLVAATPTELGERLHKLQGLLQNQEFRHIDTDEGIFLCIDGKRPRIGFLFPGQASPVRLRPGIYGRRFDEIAALYRSVALPEGHESGSTEIAQLAIITAELAGLRLLENFAVQAAVAVGHSLGELAAYCWAGALDEGPLLELVRLRGGLMSRLDAPLGAMASISASTSEVESLIEVGKNVVTACLNAPRQTVVSGESDAVAALVSRAQQRGWTATLLSAADAFHSPRMAPAAKALCNGLAGLELLQLRKTVISTITGAELRSETQLRGLLVEQLTKPVRFMQAMVEAESHADLFLEVGPGIVLTHLVKTFTDVPTISLDVAGPSLAGLFKALGAAYVLGAELRLEALFATRFARPYDPNRQLRFFVNPCEMAPTSASADAKPLTAFSSVSRTAKTNNHLTPEGSIEVTGQNGDSVTRLIRTLVATRTELPPDSITDAARFSRDLHLNSIVVSEIVASAARGLGIKVPAHLLSFADASVGELAQRLEQLCNSRGVAPVEEAVPAGIDDWCRAFLVDWTPRALRHHPEIMPAAGRWKAFGPHDHPYLLQLSSQADLPGNGVVVCMSAAPVEEQLNMLLTGAHKAIETVGAEKYLVILGPASVAGAFARTISLEHPDILTRVIEAPPDCNVIRYLRAELTRSQAHVEARYDSGGQRYEPCFKLLAPLRGDAIPIRHGEVVIVSGGAKGITAECAMALAKEVGAKLVLLGRSHKDDPRVSARVRSLESSGVVACYFQTRITDLQAVRAAVTAGEQMYGPIAGIIHGAGHNQPALVRDLDEARLIATFAPKVQGFRNLVASVDPGALRLLVTFGSVIGRVGLRGEADYALANASLSALTEDFACLHPRCRCLAFESSVWSGIGMAERLGKVETLRNAGVGSIAPAEGIPWFLKFVARTLPATRVVVTGRLGANSPIPIEAPALPLLRFLERPRVHYPGVELVVEAELNAVSDPYLKDHVFHGQPLLPAVIGIEAMVQVAMAVCAEKRIPTVGHLRFEHPIVVESGTRVTVRIAALVRETGLVDVAIRSSQTSFQMDHFRCSCSFEEMPLKIDCGLPLPTPLPEPLPMDPLRDLYGSLLFQGPRFQRVSRYRRLSARFSSAEIAPGSHQSWFSSYLPTALMLGDPAARDAALHSIQACVPDAILLPLSVDHISACHLAGDETLMAHASEHWQEGNTYSYDLELRGPEGAVRERWQGLRFRKVEDAKARDWPDPLVAACLEWHIRKTTSSTNVFAAFERNGSMERRRSSECAIQRAADSPWPVRWRADGKPEIDGPLAVSASHSNGLTLAVAAPEEVGCDLEPICSRSEDVWRDLLGPERWLLAQLIAHQAQEDIHTAATRVWTAMESLAKAEASQNGPLVLSPSIDSKGGVSLAAPDAMITTSLVRFRGYPTPFAVAVLVRSEACAATSTDTECALKRRTS